MPNITGATQFFPKASEGSVPLSLGASIAASATTVQVTNLNTNYSNGDTVVLTIDPGTPSIKQVFTGQVSTGSVLNVIWTEGTNQPHTVGATIIDYTSATHQNLMQKGLSVQHNPDGTHGAITATTLLATGNATIGGNATVTGSLNATGTITGPLAAGGVNFANLLSTIFSGQVQSQANTGSAGGTIYYINLGGIKILWGTGIAVATGTSPIVYYFNLPTFFNTVQYFIPGISNLTTTQAQYATGQGVTTTLANVTLVSTSAATAVPTCLIIGT